MTSPGSLTTGVACRCPDRGVLDQPMTSWRPPLSVMLTPSVVVLLYPSRQRGQVMSVVAWFLKIIINIAKICRKGQIYTQYYPTIRFKILIHFISFYRFKALLILLFINLFSSKVKQLN